MRARRQPAPAGAAIAARVARMDRVLRIAAVSVDAAEFERLRSATEGARAQLAAAVRWVDAADADVLLIDVDSIHGHMDWVRARGGGRRIVVLSARGGAGTDGEPTIQRPPDAAGVAAALSHWIEVLALDAVPAPAPLQADGDRPARAEAAPAPPAEPAASPQRVEATRVERPAAPMPAASPATVVADSAAPDAATAEASTEASAPPPAAVASELPLGEFCTIEALPRAARIVLGDAPALTIDNERGVYYGPTGLKALEPYARGAIPRQAWEPVSPAVLEGLRASGAGLPTARLAWLGALHAGGGRLLGGEAERRVRLARWPQIEREFPRHFRIATVMMKGFATVDEIAAQSGAQPAEVADFANASLAVGHAELEAPAATPVGAEVASGGLLGRLGLRGRKG
jgi:hypothetical protein